MFGILHFKVGGIICGTKVALIHTKFYRTRRGKTHRISYSYIFNVYELMSMLVLCKGEHVRCLNE